METKEEGIGHLNLIHSFQERPFGNQVYHFAFFKLLKRAFRFVSKEKKSSLPVYIVFCRTSSCAVYCIFLKNIYKKDHSESCKSSSLSSATNLISVLLMIIYDRFPARKIQGDQTQVLVPQVLWLNYLVIFRDFLYVFSFTQLCSVNTFHFPFSSHFIHFNSNHSSNNIRSPFLPKIIGRSQN